MASIKKSKSRSETEDDEETPSKETLARRRDRKLRDDITNLMYRLEMESIKPSFDVLLQTGLHRGLYGHNFYKKRRPATSKSLQEGIEKAGRHEQDRRSGAGKTDAWHSGDKYSTPSATHGDGEKRKTFGTEQDRAARWMSDLSPTHQSSRVTGAARSKVKPDDSLTAMVLRASADDIDSSWSSYATLPRSSSSKPYRHYPGASVISVEELPQPQRGIYRVVTDDDQAWSTAGGVSSWRASSDGPRFSVPHDDQLMTYLHHETHHSTPDDFTLSSLLARPQPAAAKQEYQRRQQYVGGSGYALDEVGELYRYLDNPFTGRQYERTSPKQQITFSSDDYGNSLPYTPKTIITSPLLRYT